MKIFDNQQFVREVSVFLLVLGTISGLSAGFYGLFKDRADSRTRDQITREQAALADDAVQKKLNDDQIAFERQIVTEIEALKKNQSGSSGLTLADRAAIDQATADQKRLAARLALLEGALINEPVKALAVPLLKKDIDELSDREKQNAAAVRAQDDRLDRLVNQIFYITFGVIGFIVAMVTYLTNRSKKAATAAEKA